MVETGRRKRFQFSLRKLLLWTTALAVLLAVMRMMEFGTKGLAIVLAGVTLLGAVRSAINPRRALILWVFVFALVGVALALNRLWELDRQYNLIQSRIVYGHVFFACLGMFCGSAIGLFTYILAELAYRFIDWLDGLMQSGDT